VAAAGGRVGWAFRQNRSNRFQNARQIPIDIAIPKSQHAEAFRRKLVVTANIARMVLIEIVLTAINLDDEMMFHANEIDDVSLAWRLPAEVEPARPPRAEVNPELHLLGRHGFS
jgi:hypothetical protein